MAHSSHTWFFACPSDQRPVTCPGQSKEEKKQRKKTVWISNYEIDTFQNLSPIASQKTVMHTCST